MTVIGIDPGLERIGIGIIKKEKNIYNLIYSKLIKTSSKDSYYFRLNKIYNDFSNILSNNQIDQAAIEKIFFAKNVKTAMSVSEVRGILLLACTIHNIPIFEYTPLQIKQSLAGYGNATKDQVKKLIQIILKLDKVPESDDVSDGLALAIVHLNITKTLSKIKI